MGAELLTTKEVEHLVQLNRVTIYRLIRDAGFPALKIGYQWRFPRAEVERWLSHHGKSSGAVVESHAPTVGAVMSIVPQSRELLTSLEVAALIETFSAAINRSILIMDVQGEILVSFPGCRNSACPFVVDATQSAEICLAADGHAEPSESTRIVRCAAHLPHFKAPVRIEGKTIGFVLMGPLMPAADQPGEYFSEDQMRLLTDLLSRITSTTLEMVYRRSDAIWRLNEIARLASDV